MGVARGETGCVEGLFEVLLEGVGVEREREGHEMVGSRDMEEGRDWSEFGVFFFWFYSSAVGFMFRVPYKRS